MVDTSAFLAASARAVPLALRGTAEVVDPERLERAGRKLARWRAQAPFDREGWFEHRLAQDGLTPAQLSDLLAEPPEALAARLGGPEPWARRLARAFGRAGSSDPLPIGEQHAFAVLVRPLLEDARDRLRQAVAALGPCRSGSVEGVTSLLLPSLTATAHTMAMRTVILELHVARLSERLSGETPQLRYRDFLTRLADPAFALDLLAEYPVLAKRLTVAADQWTATGSLLLGRLEADLPQLEQTFGRGGALGPLTGVRTGLGDAHRGGASVAEVRFGSGIRIVYKPRPFAVEEHFHRLVHALNPGLRLPLREPLLLARDGYGWMEHVTARPCADEGELRDFYHRAGTLAALLYLTGAVDCHAQNLIAAGDQPVLVDLEALFHPELHEPEKELSEAERAARTDVRQSVLRSGLLPQRMWEENGNGGTDLSALGWDPSGLPPRPSPAVVGLGTDELRIEYRRTAPEARGSRPVPDGVALELHRYAEDLDAGFVEAYELLVARRDEFRALLDAFADDETRLLRRDTLEYRSLLDTACHPDLLRDALDQDRHLDRLWALAAWEDSAGAFVAPERADLWKNDIPVFTVRPGSTDARSADGGLLPGVAARPALDAAHDRLRRMGPQDRERQRALLRFSVLTSGRDGGGGVPPAAARGVSARTAAVGARCGTTPVDTDSGIACLRGRALDKAVAAAEQLLGQAYRGAADLAWVGPNWTTSGQWAAAELGPDLYTGTAGIVLFLDRLARLTGDREHRAAADGALSTLLLQTRRRADRLGGGFAGCGGLLYALAQLSRGRVIPDVDELAALLIARVRALAPGDDLLDVMSGCAGSIGGLAAWAEIRPAGPAVHALALCVERLAGAARPQPDGGVGWVPSSLAASVDRPLAGFAHGASGFAWALGRAGRILGDDGAVRLAHAALDYERTLFDDTAMGWRDVREDGSGREPGYPSLWCHGAGGIALARVELAGTVDGAERRAERAAALRATARSGFGVNFSLCHGDLGNLDVLLLAEETRHGTAVHQAAATLDDLDARGWVCGLPHGMAAPSLMVGLAGIGYGLLRVAAPERVPSVLAMRGEAD